MVKRSLAVFLIAVMLAGCSGRDVQKAGSTVGGVKQVVMWKFKSNKEDYVIYDWVKQWNEANPGVHVELELIPYNDYLANKLPTAFATNSAPDIYMISAGGFLKYAGSGCMLPLNDYMGEDLKNDFYEQSLKAATFKGKIMGIPIEREPVALFYNKKVFREKALPLPESWEDLESCVRALHTDKMSGICIPLQPNDYQNFIFYSFLEQVGGVIDSGTETSRFSSSGAKALKLWRNLSKYNNRLETTIQSPSDIYPLASGKTAVQICGYWSVKMLEKYYSDFEYGVIPLPYPKGGKSTSVYGGWYQAVNPNSRNRDEAAAFTLWMWGGDVSRPLKWCTEASTKFPVRKSVLLENPDVFNNEISILFGKSILPNAAPEPRYPVEIANIVSKAVQDAMFTGRDIDSIAKSADDEINKYIKLNDKLF